MFELVIWMLYLQHIGWSIAEIALLQLVINWSQMFWELPSGFLADKIGRKNSIIFGQLLMSILIDNFGWFGNEMLPFSLYRLGALICLGIALYFIYSSSKDKRIEG